MVPRGRGRWEPRVRIVRPQDRLEDLTGAVVVIDIFRAGSTALALLEAGAAEVLLIAGLADARAAAGVRPGALLLAERGGLQVPGADGGNSPCAARCLARPAAIVIMSTSAGTQAVHRLARAEAIFLGTFAGAASLVRALEAWGGDEVSLLPMGLEAREPAEEDDAAAELLAARMRGEEPDFDPVRCRLLSSAGADRLRRLGQQDDLEWCLRLDVSAVVPRVRWGSPPRAVRD